MFVVFPQNDERKANEQAERMANLEVPVLLREMLLEFRALRKAVELREL
jgi:hypothetical protein